VAIENSAPGTLATPAGSIDINPASGPGWYVNDAGIDGLDTPVLRTAAKDKAQAAGAIRRPTQQGALYPVFNLDWIMDAGDFGDRVAACHDLVDALASILNTSGTYTWTESDAITREITVFCWVPAVFTGKPVKSVSFGLIAPDPTIATP